MRRGRQDAIFVVMNDPFMFPSLLADAKLQLSGDEKSVCTFV